MGIVGAILAQGNIRILRQEERLRVNTTSAKLAGQSSVMEEFCTKSHGCGSCKARGKNPRSFVAPGDDQMALKLDRNGPNS
jgi:hypothetical protein